MDIVLHVDEIKTLFVDHFDEVIDFYVIGCNRGTVGGFLISKTKLLNHTCPKDPIVSFQFQFFSK